MSDTPSNDEIRQNLLAWVHDLETTDAKQARGTLHRDGAFCCLGRACVVVGGECKVGTGIILVDGILQGGSLDVGLRDRFGLTADEHVQCARMNDADPQTPFKEIAAWLRENVLPRYPEKAAVYNP